MLIEALAVPLRSHRGRHTNAVILFRRFESSIHDPIIIIQMLSFNHSISYEVLLDADPVGTAQRRPNNGDDALGGPGVFGVRPRGPRDPPKKPKKRRAAPKTRASARATTLPRPRGCCGSVCRHGWSLSRRIGSMNPSGQ